ncbi:MAG TPA: glycosyltransferase family 39 protein [Candidatus Paceibacterota bacterium]
MKASVVFALVVAVLVGVIAARLTTTPAYWFDEAVNLEVARTFAETGHYALATSPDEYYSHSYQFETSGYPLVAPLALLFKVFGFSFSLARGMMLISLIVFLFSVYFLARHWWGDWPAVGAVALLASFPPLVFNGMSIIGEVPALALITLGLLSLDYFLERRKLLNFVLAGLAFGLALSAKPLFAPLILALFVAYLVYRKGLHIESREYLAFIIAFVLPLFAFLFLAMPQSGGFDSIWGIVSTYMGRSSQHMMGENVISNLRNLFTQASGIYTLVLALICALAFTSRSVREKLNLSRLVGFLFALIMLLFFIQSVGWGRYLLATQVALLIALPVALIAILSRFSWYRRYLVPSLIVLLCVGQFAHAITKSELRTLSGPREAELEEFLSANAPDGGVYFIDSFEAAALLTSERRYHYFRFEDRIVMPNPLDNLPNSSFEYIITKQDNPDFAMYIDSVLLHYELLATHGSLSLYKRK